MPEFFNEFPGLFVGHRLFYRNYKEDKAACLKSSTSLVSL